MSAIRLMFITKSPELAAAAVQGGVDRIFVDLELLGKRERQGHLDTVISAHTLRDVEVVRAAVPDATLLVRVNPWHAESPAEIRDAVDAGADLLMLPMFTRADEVEDFASRVPAPVSVIPLLETAPAVDTLDRLVRIPNVPEVFIGLNDLHLSLGLDFMFEPLASGLVDRMAATVLAAGRRFGFGGVARVGEGLLPGEMVLGEHVRIGSSSVILSRTFFRGADQTARLDFRREIERLREAEAALRRRSAEQVEADRLEVLRRVRSIADGVRGRRGR